MITGKKFINGFDADGIISVLLFWVIPTILVAFVTFMALRVKESHNKSELHYIMEWQFTDKDVKFFYECIGGKAYVFASVAFGNTMMAGPVGDCVEVAE